MIRKLVESKGSGAIDVIIGAAIIILLIIPVFSLVFEKYLISIKIQEIRDAVDMANLSTYMVLNNQGLGVEKIQIEYGDAISIFEDRLAANLNLNSNLTPMGGSIAEDKVTVNSLEILYSATGSTKCPNGTSIRRPTIHSMVTVPVRPSLYREIILDLLGRQYIELKVHVDSDIPIDN